MDNSLGQGGGYLVPLDSADITDPIDLAQICRLCANISELTMPIFEEEGLDHDLKVKINRYLPIKVKTNDKLPTQLCYQCASTIVAWHDLVDGCLDADKKLRSLIGDDSSNSNTEKLVTTRSSTGIIRLKPKIEEGSTDQKSVRLEPNGKKQNVELSLLNLQSPSTSSEYANVVTPSKSVSPSKKMGNTKFEKWDLHNQPHSLIKASAKSSQSTSSLHIGKMGSMSNADNRSLLINKQTNLITEFDYRCLGYTTRCKKKHVTGIEDGIMSLEKIDNKKCKTSMHSLCETTSSDINPETKLVDHSTSPKVKVKEPLCFIRKKIIGKEDDGSKITLLPAGTLEIVGDEISDTQMAENSFGSVTPFVLGNTGIKQRIIKMGVKKCLKCTLCGSTFKYATSFRRHFYSKHAGKMKGAYVKSIEQVDPEIGVVEGRGIRCKICDMVIMYKQNFIRHQRVHSGERPFVCHECGKQFRVRSDFRNHFKKVHENALRCRFCNKDFATKEDLIKHRKTPCTEPKYICDLCGKSYRIKDSFYYHINYQHRTDNYDHPCDVCGKKFQTHMRLKIHKRFHTGETPYECVECGKRFKGTSSLSFHRRYVHLKAEKEKCSICGKAYAKKSHIARHMRTVHFRSQTKTEINNE